MSPNEFQLRAALHEGEGDGIDPGDVIAEAHRIRHQRRMRYASVAAAAAVVVVIGVGGNALLSGSDSHTASSSKAGDSAGGASAPQPRSPGSAASEAVGCPATPPQLMLPGGGSPGQFGADGPLFSGPVKSITVCTYPGGRSRLAIVVSGAQATQLAASLEAAPEKPVPSSCGGTSADDIETLVMIGRSPTGATMEPVVATLCGRVTNGTALRYGWSPPGSIWAALRAATPTGPASGPPPGAVSSSPAHS